MLLLSTNTSIHFMKCAFWFIFRYKGHCPGLKFDYGETYGNATAKQFQDYRSETLNTSKSIYANGGQFPTVYTHNPDLVISARDRTRERHRIEPKYSLTNQNYDRKEELSKFDQVQCTSVRVSSLKVTKKQQSGCHCITHTFKKLCALILQDFSETLNFNPLHLSEKRCLLVCIISAQLTC